MEASNKDAARPTERRKTTRMEREHIDCDMTGIGASSVFTVVPCMELYRKLFQLTGRRASDLVSTTAKKRGHLNGLIRLTHVWIYTESPFVSLKNGLWDRLKAGINVWYTVGQKISWWRTGGSRRCFPRLPVAWVNLHLRHQGMIEVVHEVTWRNGDRTFRNSVYAPRKIHIFNF